MGLTRRRYLSVIGVVGLSALSGCVDGVPGSSGGVHDAPETVVERFIGVFFQGDAEELQDLVAFDDNLHPTGSYRELIKIHSVSVVELGEGLEEVADHLGLGDETVQQELAARENRIQDLTDRDEVQAVETVLASWDFETGDSAEPFQDMRVFTTAEMDGSWYVAYEPTWFVNEGFQ